MARLTINDIKEKLEPYGIEVISEVYVNAHEDLILKCKCGETFVRTWNNLKRSIRENKDIECNKCAKNKYGNYKRLSYIDVKTEIESHGYTLLSKTYTNAHDKLEMVCPNGHTYNAEYWSFHQGTRCPCESVQHGVRHDKEYIKNILNDKYDFTLIGDYVNAHTKMKLKCNRCNKINYLSWHQINTCKVRCIHCRDNVSSYGELRVKKFLDENEVRYTIQKHFRECMDIRTLPFDFYIDEMNIAIEYDGQQHYEKCFGMTDEELEDRRRKDNIKTQFCIGNNIKLIRIPYWDFDNIENILEKELLEERSTTRA